MKAQLTFKRNKRKQHYWTSKSKNGKVLDKSSEDYTRRAGATGGFISHAEAVLSVLNISGYDVKKLFNAAVKDKRVVFE